MTWDVVGAACVLLGGALLLWFVLPSSARSASTSSDEIADRMERHMRRSRDKRRRTVTTLASGVVLLGAVILVAPRAARHGAPETIGPARPPAAPLGGVTPVPARPGQGQLETSPSSPASSAMWSLVVASTVAVVAGALILVFAPTKWTRAAGAGTLALGLTANGQLIREVKIGDLLKFETHIDRASLEFDLNRRIKKLAEFGPEQLALLEDFEPEQAELRAPMQPKIQHVCDRWKAQGEREQRGLLLVVGSTDRVVLGRLARVQYESNVGLARTRAEQAKGRLLQCDIPASQILTLVSGPCNTPSSAVRIRTRRASPRIAGRDLGAVEPAER